MNTSLVFNSRVPVRLRRCEAELGKYAAIARCAFRQRLHERGMLVGKMGFYVVILLVFSRLWRAVVEGQAAGADPSLARDYLWYLAVTEWIMLSQPQLYATIEADVRNGDIAYHLARPVSYVGSKLAEGFGEVVLRMLALAFVGLVAARLLSGGWPSSVTGLLWAVPVAVLSSFVMLLALAAVGMGAFWISDCTAVYLVWQKLCFVLGGLLVPLSVYPPWLATVARLSPFSALLYGPGCMVMHGGLRAVAELCMVLIAWGALFALALAALSRRARRSVELNGG